MTEVNDEGKAFRVVCWLDSLEAHVRRLDDARAAMTQLEAEHDELKSSGGALERVSGVTYKPDRIGEHVARRDEKMAALSEEIELLERAARNAERTIREAWRANEGANDGAFRYVLERYARGASPEEAARVAGLGRFEARLSARRVAVMVYDSAPQLFARPIGDWTAYYGYWDVIAAKSPTPPRGASRVVEEGQGGGGASEHRRRHRDGAPAPWQRGGAIR